MRGVEKMAICLGMSAIPTAVVGLGIVKLHEEGTSEALRTVGNKDLRRVGGRLAKV